MTRPPGLKGGVWGRNTSRCRKAIATCSYMVVAGNGERQAAAVMVRKLWGEGSSTAAAGGAGQTSRARKLATTQTPANLHHLHHTPLP